MTTYAENLKLKLQDISSLIHELLDNSTIKHFYNEPGSGFWVVAPSNYWDEPSDKEQQLQLRIRPKYNRWIESFRIVTDNLSEPTKEKLKTTDIFVNNWVNKHGNDWSVPGTINESKRKFDEELKIYFDTLEMLNSSGQAETIVIPDTNLIAEFPDPLAYKQISETDSFTLILVPTVLSELDELKVKSPNQEFKNKVKSVINRIKGYRTQGSLLDGIKVNRTITVKMIATEPNFDNSLSWLNADNNDDKIIASSLEILREFPSSNLIIATGDINLQNKCEMANIPFGEIEDLQNL
jgi:hypothetical protein